MKKYTGFTLALTSLAFLFPLYARPSFRSLFSETTPLITQHSGGARACGPTALLYALKYGNSSLRSVYENLEGKDDTEKLKKLVAAFANEPSSVPYHKKRLETDSGMAVQDLFASAKEIFPDFQWENFDRRENERDAGKLATRIHESLLHSIKSGIPVVAILVPYLGKYSAEKKLNEWREHNGHYVVITGISEKPEMGAFELEYLDPDIGKLRRMSLNEETKQGFWARRESKEGVGEWIHPEVQVENRFLASPYLNVLAPGLNLAPPEAKDKQRVVVTLVGAVGKFL
jgi:hypothetical protein